MPLALDTRTKKKKARPPVAFHSPRGIVCGDKQGMHYFRFVCSLINRSFFSLPTQGSQGFQGFPGANGEKGTRVRHSLFFYSFLRDQCRRAALETGFFVAAPDLTTSRKSRGF